MAIRLAAEATLNEREHIAPLRTERARTGSASGPGRSLAVAALVLLVLLLPLLRGFDKPAKAMDEGSLLVYPELILKGSLPYRDFETFYGPGNIYLLSGVYSLFGPGILAERSTGLIYRLLILAAVFCIANRWGASIAAGATVIAGVLLLNLGVVAYAWMGGVTCALWSIFLISNAGSRVRCFSGGILAAAALLFRADLGPAVIIGTVPLFLAMHRSAKLRFLAGFCGGLLPLGVLAIAAGPRNVLDNLFLFPVFQNTGRHLPLGKASASLLGLLAAHLVASGANIVAAVVASRRASAPLGGRVLLAVSFFALGLTHQAIQRLDGMHLLFSVFASLAILPISFFVFLSTAPWWTLSTKRMIAVALSAGFVSLAAPGLPADVGRQYLAALNPNAAPTPVLENDGRRFPIASLPLLRATQTLLDRLGRVAKSGDRLFVGPADLRRTNYNDTFLYYMLPKLRPATYFLEMNPGSANRANSRLSSDIQTADWLILNRAYEDWREDNSSGRNGSDEPNRVVGSGFILSGEFGSYSLYRRKSPDG
jgi:hypothetical protein